MIHLKWGKAVSIFRKPLTAAFNDGFVGKFASDDSRRMAFWFFIFSPVLAMVGHLALYAAYSANLGLLKIIGLYLLITFVVGVLALPKSPFWAALLIAPILIAGGYGWLS